MKKTLALCALAALVATPAYAADLGGNCCSDLEERIAELEAVSAHKGNKKVSLTIYGQINAAITYIDVEDFNDTQIGQNGVDESYVGFAGRAKINNDLSAGYVLELDLRQFGLLDEVRQGPTIDVRQSFWYLKSESVGALSVGKTSNATNNFDKISTANTGVATRPLSLQPFGDTYLAGLDLPFDGAYRNAVRYDSPTIAGFFASASWGQSGTEWSGDSGDMWDVALRYAGEFEQVRLAGGVGYRVDTGTTLDLHIADIVLPALSLGETKTLLVSASAMHAPSGVFVSGYYADQELTDIGADLQMWEVQAGLENKFITPLGKTTVFGLYGELDVDGGLKPSYWGLGVVQALEPAAMDLYVTYKTYDLDTLDVDVDTFTAGARVRF